MEKIKLMNGKEVEVEIQNISYSKRNEIMSLSTRIVVTPTGQNDTEINVYVLQTEATKALIPSINIDEVTPLEGDRLFYKYAAEAFQMGKEPGNSDKTSDVQ